MHVAFSCSGSGISSACVCMHVSVHEGEGKDDESVHDDASTAGADVQDEEEEDEWKRSNKQEVQRLRAIFLRTQLLLHAHIPRTRKHIHQLRLIKNPFPATQPSIDVKGA